MEARAQLKYARISPRKVKIVCDLIRGKTFSAFMPLIAVALIYLVMVVILTWLVGILERKLRTSDL